MSTDHFDPRVSTVLRLVRESPGSKWRAAELARAVHLSQSRLRTVFVAATGQSLKSFLILERSLFASILLTSTHLSVKEISARCCVDPGHLIRTFQRQYGSTPKEYRYRDVKRDRDNEQAITATDPSVRLTNRVVASDAATSCGERNRQSVTRRLPNGS